MLEATRFVDIKDVVSVSGFVQETRLHIYYLVKFQTVISKIVMELDDFGNLYKNENRLRNYIKTEQIQTSLNSVEVTSIRCANSEA